MSWEKGDNSYPPLIAIDTQNKSDKGKNESKRIGGFASENALKGNAFFDTWNTFMNILILILYA